MVFKGWTENKWNDVINSDILSIQYTMHLVCNIIMCFASVMWALGILPWDDLNLD
jgi:hypothetical protein